jgi:hypothetical protein
MRDVSVTDPTGQVWVNAILILLWNSWKWMDTTKLDTARTLWSYLVSDEAEPWMSFGSTYGPWRLFTEVDVSLLIALKYRRAWISFIVRRLIRSEEPTACGSFADTSAYVCENFG